MLSTVSSLDKDLKVKHDSKYSVERDHEAREWIGAVTGTPLDSEKSLQDVLKDGITLCELINALMPDRKPLKPTTSKLSFKQMENIHSFLVAIAELGVRPFESFQTVDLYEGKNIIQVIDCIFAVSRSAEKKGYQGPRLGPKLATANERAFTGF